MIPTICSPNTNHALRNQLQVQKYPNYNITYITQQYKIKPWLNLLNYTFTRHFNYQLMRTTLKKT